MTTGLTPTSFVTSRIASLQLVRMWRTLRPSFRRSTIVCLQFSARLTTLASSSLITHLLRTSKRPSPKSRTTSRLSTLELAWSQIRFSSSSSRNAQRLSRTARHSKFLTESTRLKCEIIKDLISASETLLVYMYLILVPKGASSR